MSHAFIAAFLTCFLGIALIIARYTRHTYKTTSWEDLVKRLADLNSDDVAMVALDLIEEDGSRRRGDWPELGAEQVWRLVGGMSGLDKIERNCEVFIEMAVFLQTAHPEAVVIAEEFRRKTKHIQWHINRLRAGERNGNLAANFSTYAQGAVASYYLMSRQLLALCEQMHFAGLDSLRVAL